MTKPVLNKARILELANMIEAAPDEAFDMGDFSRKNKPVSCGSPGCIAGWAITQYRPSYPWGNYWLAGDPAIVAGQLLGLDDDQADRLFHKEGATNDVFYTSKSNAVAVLRHFAETGEIDWDRFEAPPKDD